MFKPPARLWQRHLHFSCRGKNLGEIQNRDGGGFTEGKFSDISVERWIAALGTFETVGQGSQSQSGHSGLPENVWRLRLHKAGMGPRNKKKGGGREEEDRIHMPCQEG